MTNHIRPLSRLWNLVREERSDISAIYFYAILGGLIQLSLPLGIQAIIGFFLSGTLSVSLVVLISVLVIGVALTGLMQVNQMKIIERIQQRLFTRYALDFASKIPRLDLLEVDHYYMPEHVNRFFETISIQKCLSKLLLDIPAAMIQVFFGLIILSLYHPFFIAFGFMLILIVWLILYSTSKRGLETSIEESNYKYEVAGWLEEIARLIKVFKVSASKGLYIQKTNDKTINYLTARKKHFYVLVIQYRSLVVFKILITAAMLIGGVNLLLNEQINIGQFVAAEVIILSIISSVEKSVINLDSVYDMLTGLEKVASLTDKPTEESGSFQYQGEKGMAVQVQDLSFGYDSGKLLLNQVSIKATAGEKVCIMGSDGSGKTTLLKILMGSYRNFEGTYTINEIPFWNYDIVSLREKIGIFFPAENIFNGTVWENITMGREEIDRNYVVELARKCGLTGFINSLPLGYDSILDPTGKKLPRNVIQKIGLLRALAHQPKLVLMEEPWQSAEQQYRSEIQEMILNLKDTTVIINSNDPTFASKCDRTIQL